jgi:hypothetical protein
MAPSPASHFELNVLMGTAPSDSPMVALMVIPPSTSSVVSDDVTTVMMQSAYQLQTINLRNPEGFGAATTTSGRSMKAIEDGQIQSEDPLLGHGMKRLRDTDGDQPEGGLKLPRTESSRVPGIPKPSTALQADAPTAPQAAPPTAPQAAPPTAPQAGPPKQPQTGPPRQPQAGPSRVPQAGPSTVKATGKPVYIPDSQELVVLPLMPRSLFDELTTFTDDPDSSATEPETSEDEQRARAKKLGK